MMGSLTEWDFYIGFGYGAVLAEATRKMAGDKVSQEPRPLQSPLLLTSV